MAWQEVHSEAVNQPKWIYIRLEREARGGVETGWVLGPFTAVLAPGQTSFGATENKETIRD